MSPNPKFVQLIKSLKTATEQGRIEWSETVDEHTFRALLPNAIVRIAKVFNEKMQLEDQDLNEPAYIASLVDDGGEVLESVTSGQERGQHYVLLSELFELARRRARRIDDLLDRLITNVDSGRR
jgi:hypothetical protein